MSFKSDIEIAQETTMQPITEVAKTAGIDENQFDYVGWFTDAEGKTVYVYNPADYTIIDPGVSWTVDEDDFYSRSKNSAFLGWELTGRATDVFVDGYASMEDGVVTF